MKKKRNQDRRGREKERESGKGEIKDNREREGAHRRFMSAMDWASRAM